MLDLAMFYKPETQPMVAVPLAEETAVDPTSMTRQETTPPLIPEDPEEEFHLLSTKMALSPWVRPLKGPAPLPSRMSATKSFSPQPPATNRSTLHPKTLTTGPRSSCTTLSSSKRKKTLLRLVFVRTSSVWRKSYRSRWATIAQPNRRPRRTTLTTLRSSARTRKTSLARRERRRRGSSVSLRNKNSSVTVKLRSTTCWSTSRGSRRERTMRNSSRFIMNCK